MRKNIFALTLITVLASSLAIYPSIPVNADTIQETEQTTDSINSEEQTYIYDDVIQYVNCGDHIKITSVKWRSAIVIPEEIDNLPVTELAERLFKDNYGIESVSLPETITVIPEEAFYNAYDLTAVVLPSSLERIESNAFAKCERNVDAGNPVYHKIEDVFYRGNSVDWDKVYIAEGNDLLKSANVHCEFNKPKSEKQTFEYGKDNWSFSQFDVKAYSIHMRKYHVQESTLERLLSGCGDHVMYLSEIYTDYETVINYPTSEGMALISFLVSKGILSPSDIYEGAESLYDVPLCDEVIEVINYYSMAVANEALYSRMLHGNHRSTISYLPDVKDVLDELKNRTPVMLEYVDADGVKCVVAYGLEYGEWYYNDYKYTSRIIASPTDVDDPKLDPEDAYIYFTEEETGNFNSGYIPFHNADNNTSEDTNMAVVSVLKNPDWVLYSAGNSVSYASSYSLGNLNQDNNVNSEDATMILQAAALLGSGNENNLNNGQEYAADVNADGKINAEDAGLILQYSAAIGSGEFSGELSKFVQQMIS